jgi:hypothetical protein
MHHFLDMERKGCGCDGVVNEDACPRVAGIVPAQRTAIANIG